MQAGRSHGSKCCVPGSQETSASSSLKEQGQQIAIPKKKGTIRRLENIL